MRRVSVPVPTVCDLRLYIKSTYDVIDPTSDIDVSDSDDVVIDTDLHPETLLVTCHNIVSQWHKDTIAATRQYAGLDATWTASYNLQDRNLSKIDVLQLMSSDSSILEPPFRTE